MSKSAVEAPRIKWLVEPTYDDDGVQRSAGIDQFGREHGDPVPLRPPVGLNVSQGDELHATLKKLFQRERAAFMAAIEAEHFETEDEANDFLCEEDIFPPGNEPWEDVHEFPADAPEGATNGPTLASTAVKGGYRGPDEPTPPVASNQKSSSGSLPELSTEMKVETQKGDVSRERSQGGPSVVPSGRQGSI